MTPSNIDKLVEKYQYKAEIYPKIMEDIMKIITSEMIEDVYPDTEIIPIERKGNQVISGIRNNEPKWTYHEYGTGIMGSKFPHVSEVLAKAGWKYDINQHGEQGWWYPTDNSDNNPIKWTSSDGQVYGWTKGLVAERQFYDALERAKERLPDVASDVFEKYSRKGDR